MQLHLRSKQTELDIGRKRHWVAKNVLNLESQQNEIIGRNDNRQPTT
jgi:hypothetical protein